LSGDRQFHNDFEAISSGPSTRLLNIVGEPTAWKARGNVGWTKAGFQATLAVNYANRYENVYFVPSEPVASWTTTDLYLGYVTGDADSSALIRNVTLGLALRNVTNARPPKVLLPDADLAGGLIPQLPYDPANASPTGRIIALSLTKKW
jgi:hypothetical protein